ncbi:MAG TPA: tRNA uracil 4-sulfurtransferase ThiI [Thermoclostridium caenicola]|uniref:tRNA uracil 4-sulfurtransferase ThiI n=1 Tax=Thermoclostridium caenicola TaxID=659425 RepID=UPI002D04DC04|nr:tRNA uracil 4-sulfurtransferase ThiI [Thermoclostridium caenicola]HOP72865.1 tRNA uracil 4-sulfurtransferase ThiI [Thermoclostridium caenicola]HPO76382.1 tRNA uracil 4-sulfurtransferase ThiI [Thermoclostridium caenicola]HPU22328.1 tRNA uracil 4-sulfurtransferase ThiI [Thermoclostridium caenicola]
MEKVILVRYEEIFLKRSNRNLFENRLIRNIRQRLESLGNIRVTCSQSRIYIEIPDEDFDLVEAVERLKKVFGIASLSIVHKVPTDYEIIKTSAVSIVADLLSRYHYRTFKVESKRADKSFPLNSPQLSADLGAHILRNFPRLKVDVRNPDFVFYIEVRESTYLYSEIIPAAKGLPTGTGGRATLLLSGGIDSPVAGWMIAKRGVEVDAVYFHSPPYTSERAREKVVRLSEILSEWTMGMRLYVVPFTEIQMAIHQKCPQEYLTIIMRRYMMKIAERIARNDGSLALITGEAIGQVASQTMESLLVTNSAVSLPVYRPLIGMDKNEVVSIARHIGTYDTSILPYEDCCTIFVARHPATRPSLEKTLDYESVLDEEQLIAKALEQMETIIV